MIPSLFRLSGEYFHRSHLSIHPLMCEKIPDQPNQSIHPHLTGFYWRSNAGSAEFQWRFSNFVLLKKTSN